MRRFTLALVALAAGAGAMYYLDSEHGRRRRAEVRQRLDDWGRMAQREASGRGADLRSRLAGLLAEARSLLQRRRDQAAAAMPEDDEGLEPLSFAPEPLEQGARRSKVLPALAMAAPVAVALGAAVMLRQRHESGDWLH
jgi:hypothetical protein